MFCSIILILIVIHIVVVMYSFQKPPALIYSVVVTDNLGAKVYRNFAYETHMLNNGYKGYKKVVKTIEKHPDPKYLAINLNCLSAFYAAYNTIGDDEICFEIMEVLNELLQSDNVEDVQAAVSEIYYDFDILASNNNKKTVELLEKLRTSSNDEYTVRFATLCLNKMYAFKIPPEDTYPVPPRTKQNL